MWSIRVRNGFFTVAFGCWCFHLVKTQQSQQIETPEVLLCDELCEFSAWAMHAYCGERMLVDLPLQCRDVKTLDVRLNNIHSLKSGLLSEFQSLKYLFLGENNMSEVEDGAFERCEDIQFLSWGGNNFPSLARSKFVGLTNLMHMLLSNSNIIEIEAEAFREMPLLKSLDLSANKFISPPCDVLHLQNVLTDMDLSDNFISILPERCFSRFQQLVRLKLSNNPIGLITNMSAFEGLRSLKKLEMDNTSLTSLPVGSFRHFHGVTEFVLSFNLIRVLEERSFVTLPELQVLRFEHNQIHTIHPKTFTDLQNLRLLILSKNKIVSIGLHAFLPVETSLEELHLDGNQLQSIQNISISSIRSLKVFSLKRNPLKCHCHLSVLRSRIQLADANVTCRLPDRHDDFEVNILDTTLTATPCPKPMSKPTPVRSLAQIGSYRPTRHPDPLLDGETTEKPDPHGSSTSQQSILYILIVLIVLTVVLVCSLLVWWIFSVKMKKEKKKSWKYSKATEEKLKYISDSYNEVI